MSPTGATWCRCCRQSLQRPSSGGGVDCEKPWHGRIVSRLVDDVYERSPRVWALFFDLRLHQTQRQFANSREMVSWMRMLPRRYNIRTLGLRRPLPEASVGVSHGPLFTPWMSSKPGMLNQEPESGQVRSLSSVLYVLSKPVSLLKHPWIHLPLFVIKIRIQTSPLDTPASFLGAGRQIVAKHGWSMMFRGLGITLIRAFPVNGTIFPVYEFTLEHLTGL